MAAFVIGSRYAPFASRFSLFATSVKPNGVILSEMSHPDRVILSGVRARSVRTQSKDRYPLEDLR